MGSLFPSAAISKLQASSSTDTEACNCCLWGGGHEVDPMLNRDEGDGWETVLSPSTTKRGAGGGGEVDDCHLATPTRLLAPFGSGGL